MTETQSDNPFLRAINLAYDADSPDRIAHYQPTGKAIEFLKGVSGQTENRAFFVIAPYGSGKSIGATYLLHLIENQPNARPVLDPIGKRLASVDPELADFAVSRTAQDNPHGIVLALEGAESDIGEAVGRAAAASLRRLGLKMRAREVDKKTVAGSGIKGAINVLDYLIDRATQSTAKTHIDRIAIIWDEFGRHVEQMVRAGRPDQLADIQKLAEYAARCQKLPVTFGPILHQGLLQYAAGINQTALAEWRKIEGRFEPIQFVDDSYEIYWLIAKLVSRNRPYPAISDDEDARAQAAQAQGLFDEFGAELAELLSLASPLDPATLYILPQLAARVAQHERTLFGFLLGSDLSGPVTADRVYDYFASAMQADTALGGTYRKWLETESALAKADDAQETRALKIASVLELGLSGSQKRVTRDLLVYALGDDQPAAETVASLLDRKLLLHRRRSDQVSLWHGTDIDLRTRLDEEMARQGLDIDCVDQLNTDFPPSPIRPVRHNDDYGVRRYFTGEFLTVDTLKQALANHDLDLSPGMDGHIVYLVPLNEAERKKAVELAHQCAIDRLIVVVPTRVNDFQSAVAETRALERLASDESLLAEDPLAEQEIQQMLDEAQGHLHAQVGLLTAPGDDTIWIHRGETLAIRDTASLLSRLSDICDRAFHATPVIHNEMIVRHRLSGPLVNARKKLVMGILERHGQERLGIQGENADASIFRTVLERTGLYRPTDDGAGYRYAHPEEIADANLAAVWDRFRTLVTEPSEQPKDLATFFDGIIDAPIGLRRGLIPIFLAASLRAFQTTLVMTDAQGDYIDDLRPSVIEAICNHPEDYAITVFEFNELSRDYLHLLTQMFSSKPASDTRNSGDLMRQAYDAFEAWRTALPPGARDSRVIEARGRLLQSVVRMPSSPYELFFRRFPELADSDDLTTVARWVHNAKTEMEGVLSRYRDKALESLDDCLQLDSEAPADSVRLRFDYWRQLLPEGIGHAMGGNAQNLINLNLDFYRDDASFIDAAAALLVGRQTKRWDDSELQRFRNEISSVTSRIEASALTDTALDGAHATELLERRLKTYLERFVGTVGAEDALGRIQTLVNQIENEAHYGESKRSAGNGQ